ncbi:hypothetical protein L9F63_008210, partial [Diploptera punctata]
ACTESERIVVWYQMLFRCCGISLLVSPCPDCLEFLQSRKELIRHVVVAGMETGGGVVKDLQAALFPVCTKEHTQTNQVEINTDNRTLKPIAKLKEPRELFALPKELDCPQQAARWPSECQVLEERVQHIETSPPLPEQYYQPTGREVQPKPVGEEAGQVVFQYYPVSAVNYFSRSSVGGSKYFLEACPCGDRVDGLRFESRFESGNLAKVVKITDSYYELYLRTDMYTNRHMQWYYFRVENMRNKIVYQHFILNMCKAESLYSVGMRPLLYSTKEAQLNGIGWRRSGENISYYRNEPLPDEEDQLPSYTLTFNIEFPHDNDRVYLAHCYPYTYSDLQDYLIHLQNHPVKSTYSKLRLLCRSLAGNNVYYLTVTAPSQQDEPKKKKAIVVTARVHPGETPASWMMKGFLDFLTGDSLQARELRDKFIFKLVPMLNPDGVIVGNNRCSLTGRDLNRQYRTVIRETYPPVWHTQTNDPQTILRLMEESGIEMYCDLHAHSRKHNVFIYGCENRRTADRRLQEQVFPLMLHKNAADKINFIKFKDSIMEGTGRVVVWMMGVANSYTMEASFGGSSLGGRTGTHFTTQDYEQMGRHFCETLLDFCDQDPSKVSNKSKVHWNLQRIHSKADFRQPSLRLLKLLDTSCSKKNIADLNTKKEATDTIQELVNSKIKKTELICSNNLSMESVYSEICNFLSLQKTKIKLYIYIYIYIQNRKTDNFGQLFLASKRFSIFIQSIFVGNLRIKIGLRILKFPGKRFDSQVLRSKIELTM